MKKLLLTLACTIAMTSAHAQQDRGFIHPGGLHTQADFDRVKQQIADGDAKVTQAYNVLKTAALAPFDRLYSLAEVAAMPKRQRVQYEASLIVSKQKTNIAIPTIPGLLHIDLPHKCSIIGAKIDDFHLIAKETRIICEA